MRPSLRRLSVVPLCSLAACASGGTAPIESATGTTQNTVRVDGGAGSVYQTQLTHSDRATENELPVNADRAYAALPLVYEQIGLAVNTAVSDARTIGLNAVRTRHVGKDPLSRFLSCGSDITGMALADTYAVTLTVLSRITPQGPANSLLSTQVIATAQPMSVSGSQVNCQSTGELEQRIAKATLSRAGS